MTVIIIKGYLRIENRLQGLVVVSEADAHHAEDGEHRTDQQMHLGHFGVKHSDDEDECHATPDDNSHEKRQNGIELWVYDLNADAKQEHEDGHDD